MLNKITKEKVISLFNKHHLPFMLPVLFTVLLFIASIFFLIIPTQKKHMVESNKHMIHELTISTWHILNNFHRYEKAGLLTRKEAQTQAKELIRNMRYGYELHDYFWIINTEHICILNPFSQQLEGSNLVNLADVEGTPFIREFVETAKNHECGYVKYMWKWKNDPSKIRKKISFLKLFKPWNWIIGTGMYPDDVNKEIAIIMRNSTLICIAITIIGLFLAFYVIQKGIEVDNKRRETEELLRDGERKYRALIETTDTGWVILNDIGEVIDSNRKFALLSGYTSIANVIGKNILDWTTVRDRKIMKKELKKCLESKPMHGIEVEYVDKDGKTTPVEINATKVEEENDIRIMALCRDISVRKQREQESRRLDIAISQAAESVVITDKKGSILYVNPAFEKMTGFTKDEAIGKTTGILSSGKHSKKFYNDLWAIISSGKTWRGHFINKKKDGTLFEEDAVISPVKNSSGNIINYVAVKRDVTNEIILEEQVRQSQKMAAVGQLAHRVAHDFTNVLVIIMGNAQLAKVKSDGAEVHKHLNDIIESANKISTLTAELLAFAHPSPATLKILDLNKVILGMEEILKRTIDPIIELVINAKADRYNVKIDPLQIEQIVVHISLNAMDAMPKGGKLTIETSIIHLSEGKPIKPFKPEILQDAEYFREFVVLSITDTGMGMDDDTKARIFEPFFTSKKDKKRSGLGLSTVYNIIEHHNANIIVESHVGEGTTFKIFFPKV